jgi:dTDP-4-dehydrorhamnose reductase
LTAPVLVIGATGQLAAALSRLGVVAARPVVAIGRPDADLARPEALGAKTRALAPALVINAAAYTAVDKAESEPEIAFRVNAEGAGALAAVCAEIGAPLIHVSTDYVFDGAGARPYPVDAPIAPLGVYGRSKAEGESLVRARLPRHLIVRTAWVYGEDGTNFLKTMLRLGASRPVLTVVDDQRGSPTYAADLAQGLARMASAALEPSFRRWGTYHLTNSGDTTWHGFAREIFRLAAQRGLPVPRLEPIPTRDYPTPARRPAYSVLDLAAARSGFGLEMADWRDALARCFARLELTDGIAA